MDLVAEMSTVIFVLKEASSACLAVRVLPRVVEMHVQQPDREEGLVAERAVLGVELFLWSESNGGVRIRHDTKTFECEVMMVKK